MAKSKTKEEPKTVSGIPVSIRDAIVAQSIKEIAWDRRWKQGKIRNWQKNEIMYYSKKTAPTDSRANVDLARMQEFVHKLLAKIDNPLTFKFTLRKPAQLKRVALLNGLKTSDHDTDNWDMKDLVGKKQGIIYGRCVNHYCASDYDGKDYKSNLTPIDVYDYLIDPAGGGYDLEKARNMGDYGVVLSTEELNQGVKDEIYDEDIVKTLIDGGANNTETNQEQTNKLQRTYDQNTFGQKENKSDDKFKFWRWHTTFYNKDTGKSERYYLLMREKAGQCIRIEKLTDLYSATNEFPLGAWPYWSWAAFPDMTEFWTPSYCDYARELLQAQYTTINQGLDNTEAVNKPQKAVVIGNIENPNELKYRRDGIIKVKLNQDINKTIQMLNVPPIDTPLKMFEVLEAIFQKALGVDSTGTQTGSKDEKVAIYEGNQADNADQFGLLNKSYSFGYRRFARLWEVGVKDHLIQDTAIEIVGPSGITIKSANHTDIFKREDRYGLMVEANNAETMASTQKQTTKLAFLGAHGQDPIQNPKKAYEMEAKTAGFTDDEIKQLMDLSEFGNSELMAQCDADIECLLEGEKIKPNSYANAAYAQKIKDYVQEHLDEIKAKKRFPAFLAYMKAIIPNVMRNEHRALRNYKVNMMNNTGANATPPVENAGEGAPSNAGLPVVNLNNKIPAR